jgi:hypothetical protein
MFTIDLLKGQGIPARSRPEGIIATAATAVIPVVIAITMLGIYLSNRVVINIQKGEISGYEQKTAELSEAMRTHRLYQQRKDVIRQRICEAAAAIGGHEQWSDILVTVVENMPESLVLRKIAVEPRMAKIKVPDSKDPENKVDKMVPAWTLYLTFVSQQVEMKEDKEVITYEMKCIMKPKV